MRSIVTPKSGAAEAAPAPRGGERERAASNVGTSFVASRPGIAATLSRRC